MIAVLTSRHRITFCSQKPFFIEYRDIIGVLSRELTTIDNSAIVGAHFLNVPALNNK